MRQDVLASLIEFTPKDKSGAEALYSFSKNLTIFEGHLPGKPLVPGILELEMVRTTAEKLLGLSLCVSKVIKAKFTNMLLPNSQVLLSIKLSNENNEYIASAKGIDPKQEQKIFEAKVVMT